ncbi:unnamed protein product, partial [Amoebophrya sp. A25]
AWKKLSHLQELIVGTHFGFSAGTFDRNTNLVQLEAIWRYALVRDLRDLGIRRRTRFLGPSTDVKDRQEYNINVLFDARPDRQSYNLLGHNAFDVADLGKRTGEQELRDKRWSSASRIAEA